MYLPSNQNPYLFLKKKNKKKFKPIWLTRGWLKRGDGQRVKGGWSKPLYLVTSTSESLPHGAGTKRGSNKVRTAEAKALLSQINYSLMHNLTHMGPRATVKHVAERYVRPETFKQLTRWAQECHKCQQSKLNGQPGVRTSRSQRYSSQWCTQTWSAYFRCLTGSNTYSQPREHT